MQSAFHNLPTVNGIMQREGQDFAAREVEHTADERTARLVLDIGAAYPPDTGIERWTRSLELRRGQCIEITDEYALTQNAEAVEMSLLTPCGVRMGDPGVVLLEEVALDAERTSGSGVIDYEADRLSVAVEQIPITDDNLRGVWGDCIHRLVFHAETPAQSGGWTLRIRDADEELARGESDRRPGCCRLQNRVQNRGHEKGIGVLADGEIKAND